MKKKYVLNIILIFILLSQSCKKDDFSSLQITEIGRELEMHFPLYVNNPMFPDNFTTKNNNYVNLKNNIVVNSAKKKIVNKNRFIQYEILNERTYSIAKSIFDKGEGKVISICKQFFIVKEDIKKKSTFNYLVTMISFDSFDNKSKHSFTYFENKSFNGLMIFSNTNGEILKSLYFNDNKRYNVEFVNKERVSDNNSIKLLLYERITNKSFAYDPNLTYLCGDCGAVLLVDDFMDFRCTSCGMLLGILDEVYCIWYSDDGGGGDNGNGGFYDDPNLPHPEDPGSGGGANGGIPDSPTFPKDTFYIMLHSSANVVTLLNSYTLSIEITPSDTPLTNVIFFIYGNANSGQLYELYNGLSPIFNRVARVPGVWNINAMVTLNGVTIISNTVVVEEQFPSNHEIISDQYLVNEMNNAWYSTLSFASYNGRREKGFWIYMDSRESATLPYFKEDVEDGPVITGGVGTNGQIFFPPPTLQQYSQSPLTGGVYTVGMFHTHTPITYISEQAARRVGPSDEDINYATAHNVVGLLYDYTGNILDNNMIGIVSGHSLDDPSQIYTFGPERRVTLPN